MNKLFGFDLSKFVNDVSEIMNFMITKKTIAELEQEDIRIKNELRSTNHPITNEQLEMQQGLVAGALMYKQVIEE